MDDKSWCLHLVAIEMNQPGNAEKTAQKMGGRAE